MPVHRESGRKRNMKIKMGKEWVKELMKKIKDLNYNV